MAKDDEYYMRLALKEAQRAYAEDEVPVGAVLADGSVLAATHNTSEHGLHALAHAETVAMSIGAISLEQKRLWDCTLYVTLEPCTMCAAALSMMRIKRLVYGAANPKGGAVENGVKFFESAACNHRPEIAADGIFSGKKEEGRHRGKKMLQFVRQDVNWYPYKYVYVYY